MYLSCINYNVADMCSENLQPQAVSPCLTSPHFHFVSSLHPKTKKLLPCSQISIDSLQLKLAPSVNTPCCVLKKGEERKVLNNFPLFQTTLSESV